MKNRKQVLQSRCYSYFPAALVFPPKIVTVLWNLCFANTTRVEVKTFCNNCWDGNCNSVDFTQLHFYSIKTLIIRHECSARCSQLNHTRRDSIHSAFPTGRQPLKRRFYRRLVQHRKCVTMERKASSFQQIRLHSAVGRCYNTFSFSSLPDR